jgi:hypothetical protein
MDLPSFVQNGAFNWSALGYHYVLSPKEREQVESEAPNENPWFEVARVVERAKRGDFSGIGSLNRFFDINLKTNVAPVAMLITGDLGPKTDLSALVKVMRQGPDGFRVYACQAARNAGCLWLVPHMLEAWHLSDSADAHESIGFAIADLLDPICRLDQDGEIAVRAGHFTIRREGKLASSKLEQLAVKVSDPNASKTFNDLVMRRFHEISASCADDSMTIWAGRVMGVQEFAHYFLKMITMETFMSVQSSLTIALREKFEASTGLDCSKLYHDGRFRQISAIGVLEPFLDSAESDRFETGARYFFSHRIPD